jgi:hypothetical protein
MALDVAHRGGSKKAQDGLLSTMQVRSLAADLHLIPGGPIRPDALPEPRSAPYPALSLTVLQSRAHGKGPKLDLRFHHA